MSSQLQRLNRSRSKVLDRRLIEETFPISEVSKETTKEKNIRHGNISALHVWWARKPLGSSRATCFASLIPAPLDQGELQRKKALVVKLSKFGDALDRKILDGAKTEILASNEGIKPKALDPFGGGGSIPFEALRLGCDTYASDYNPVATLILKCTVEFPQKYGASTEVRGNKLSSDESANRLLEDVKKWGKWVLGEAEKDIGRFYPKDPDGSIPVGYLWSRTIPCQNPSCGARIPLMTQFWLSKKGGVGISLQPSAKKKAAEFDIVKITRKHPGGFDPDRGSVSRAIATCLVCGSVIDGGTTSKLFRTGKSSEEMVAVVLHKSGEMGKKYRLPTTSDIDLFEQAKQELLQRSRKLSAQWGISAIPDEPTPEAGGSGAERAFGLRNYNMNSWGDLFNTRQQLVMLTFTENVRMAYSMMIEEGLGEDYSRAVATYLAFGIDKLADFGSSLCTLNQTGGRGVAHTFVRPVLQMVWTYTESNPFNPFGAGWLTACEKNEEWIEDASMISDTPATVWQSSATNIRYPADFFDAVFTDPPYYDNVPYSHLSDFFYVWLKRSIGHLFPDLFTTPLSPKSEEIVAYSQGTGGLEEGKKLFEEKLRRSFSEITRVLRPNGIVTVAYAHMSTAGWETLMNSLLASGLVVTGAWPIHTEKEGRLRSRESAALASSTYMIARKIPREPVGFYRDVRQQLREHLDAKLDHFWGEQISGADFFIAAIGSSIEVFGKYQKIMDDEGKVIDAARLLDDVRTIVTNFAVKRVLHDGFAGEISLMTRFYVLWRWAYGESKLEYDDAKKLAQGVGLDLQKESNKGFIRKDKGYVTILGPEERGGEELESKEVIDVLHRVLLLWKKDKNEEILNILKETGLGGNEVFFSVAEAVSRSLGSDSKERKLLEGFLQGRRRISEDIRRQSEQAKLFE